MINLRDVKTFQVQRQVWVDDMSDEENVGEVTGTLQQASQQFALSLNLTVSKTFLLWLPVNSDVKDGDVLIDNDTSYAVKGIQKNDYGINKHTEVVLERYGDTE